MSTCNIENRTVFCRDNLDILQGINSNCIDLIYLDPPFNKKKVFTAPIGSSAEGASFRDIFKEEDVKDEWIQTIEEDEPRVHTFLIGVKNVEGKRSYNYCYLAYMAIRLMEMRRILKDTGSLYLHCDPTMSHYLKLLLDYIFGEQSFRNEIIWWYYNIAVTSRSFLGRKHDIILWYSKSTDCYFNYDIMREPYEKSSNWVRTGGYKKDDRYKPNTKGKRIHDVWRLPTINNMSKERVGYPTQKPIKLLERIIQASSNEGDVVLDPFCGCATTCVAAEKLKRKWIGVDVSIKAYELVLKRLDTELEKRGGDLFKELVVPYMSPPKRTDTTEGAVDKKYIYIISNKHYPDEYKVGIASDVKKRLSQYQTADPDRGYTLEFELLTEKARDIEKHIHSSFTSKYEWVQASKEQIIEAIGGYRSEHNIS